MSYNGWKNRATWNAALWIGNDERIYHLARQCKNYSQFVVKMKNQGCHHTGDGIAWDDPSIDQKALDECITELNGGADAR